MITKIMEFYYYVTSKPYFVVYVTSNNRRVKRFIQLAASKDKGSDICLISKELKSAWFKPNDPVIDGLKFLCFVDLNNAIPLTFEEQTEYETSEYTIKETKKIIIKEDIEKQKKEGIKNGVPKRLVEISFPATLLFQEIDAHFIKEILSIPPNKNDWLIPVLIAAVIGIVILAYFFMNKGGPVVGL